MRWARDEYTLQHRVYLGGVARPCGGATPLDGLCAHGYVTTLTLETERNMPFKNARLNALLGLCLFGATLLPLRTAQADSFKVAVVDLQRALQETEDGRAAKAQLQSLFKKRQQALDKQQTKLKNMKADIEKQKSVLSRPALQQRLEAYQKSFIDLQTKYGDFQRELAQKEGVFTKGILESMQSILRRIGQAEGYDLVLERNEGGVIWAPSHYDLTDRLIQTYNKEKKKSGKK